MFLRLPLVIIAIAAISWSSAGIIAIAKEYQTAINQDAKVGPGSRATIRNEFGSITIEGWDRDTVQALAVSRDRSEAVPVIISDGSSGNKKILIATTAEHQRSVKGKIDLQVKLPRYVELEPIDAGSNDLTVSDIDGAVSLRTDNGNISLRRLGLLRSGLVDITTGNGNVEVSDINGDVHVVSINSKVNIQCVKGDVALRDTSGQTTISDIGGDVEINTSSGRADFTGAIHPAGRYRLKTLSGAVSMSIPDKVGFTAVLSSYRGHIVTDFEFPNVSQTPPSKTNHRIIGRFGEGGGRIELDSFDGRVRLSKVVASGVRSCQR